MEVGAQVCWPLAFQASAGVLKMVNFCWGPILQAKPAARKACCESDRKEGLESGLPQRGGKSSLLGFQVVHLVISAKITGRQRGRVLLRIISPWLQSGRLWSSEGIALYWTGIWGICPWGLWSASLILTQMWFVLLFTQLFHVSLPRQRHYS